MEQWRLSTLLDQPIRVPVALRVVVAAIVLCGGVVFVLVGAYMLHSPRLPLLRTLPSAALLLALGGAFALVGWRLAKRRAESKNLFGPTGRKICGLVTAGASLCMALAWLRSHDVSQAEAAAVAAFLAYWLLRQPRHTEAGRGERVV